jgi:hypothetical protein
MKIIITESQLKNILLNEQFGLPHEVRLQTNAAIGLKELRSKYPNTFDNVVSVGLWFVPYVGPLLSAGYSASIGVTKIMSKDKNTKVAGIIELLTSPLALMKIIRVLKFTPSLEKTVSILTKIHKIGVPLLINKGQEAFFMWGYETFGADTWDKFMNFLNNKNEVQKVLSDTHSEIVKSQKTKIT